MADFLPIIIAVIIVLAVAGTVIALMMNREAERKKRALSVIKGQSSGGEIYSSLTTEIRQNSYM